LCDFGASEILIATAVMSAATTAASAYSSYQGQKMQAEMQQQQNDQQTKYFNDARIQTYNQGAQQEQYVNQQAWEKQYSNTQASRAAEATAMTSAGEGGITGTSVDALRQSYDANRGAYNSDLEFNRNADINQIQTQLTGTNIQTQGGINTLRPAVQPSWINPALQIATGAGNAYMGGGGFNGYRDGLRSGSRITPDDSAA
jgi:hypothetical protein